MTDEDSREQPRTNSDKNFRSALNVMKGIPYQHDGMPSDNVTGLPGKPRTGNLLSVDEYLAGIRDGDRTVLGRAITLVESNAPSHQQRAQELLKAIMPDTGKSVRVGITGVPGAGKSTFIEALGCQLTQQGHKVAVMAVDPSSNLTGGSILGDKTRMERLSRDPNAFIRPSPSGGTLGGVARKTRETMLVFEAAGYDVVLVETIGVGQSEITVRSMVDCFLLVLIAGAGDELQGMKKGVFELADLVIVNKADGDNIEAARRARADYERALHYLLPATKGWHTKAFTASALTGDGIDDIWKTVEEFRRETATSGAFEKRRLSQTKDWLHSMLQEQLRDAFYQHPAIVDALPGIEQKVIDGLMPATQAAWELLTRYAQSLADDNNNKRTS